MKRLHLLASTHLHLLMIDFHHHFLFDVTLESDFSAEGTFNLICNSAKMAKAFSVIYSLIIVNVDDLTSVGDSINMDVLLLLQ